MADALMASERTGHSSVRLSSTERLTAQNTDPYRLFTCPEYKMVHKSINESNGSLLNKNHVIKAASKKHENNDNGTFSTWFGLLRDICWCLFAVLNIQTPTPDLSHDQHNLKVVRGVSLLVDCIIIRLMSLKIQVIETNDVLPEICKKYKWS